MILEAVVYTLVVTHITNVAVAIYLHRGVSHGTLEFHPILDHFFRFWLWLTDGVNIRDWVVTHRLHHIFTDVKGDPHSPKLEGMWIITVRNFFITLLQRYKNYYPDWTTRRYSKGVKDDWLERNLYQPYQRIGLLIMLIINIALFGFLIGLIIWVVQLCWTPFWSNSFITGVCHWKIGYKHPKVRDESKNIPFLGFFLIGDEMHSNHHAEPWNPCLRKRWFEFDLGWQYIKFFMTIGLIKLKREKS